MAQEGRYRLRTAPEDLTLFEEVSNQLADGLLAGHTQSSVHGNLELDLEDTSTGKEITLSFPDYAGEQVDQILNGHKVNPIWQTQLDSSTSWVLFIRLDKIVLTEDMVNRPQVDLSVIKRQEENEKPLELSEPMKIVDLLQILLHIKGISITKKIATLKLTVVLSCWDLLKIQEEALPAEVLKQHLPLVYGFLQANWLPESLEVIGLSSLGKDLDQTKRDHDYILKGAEAFGYLILPNGAKTQDLTLVIQHFGNV
jgi:hypothetical protein